MPLARLLRAPVLLEELLLKPKHSLIDQSLHSRMGAETTNGDGFGIGWYGVGDTPGIFHSSEPAWNDRNLTRARRTSSASPLVLRAHPRVDRRRRSSRPTATRSATAAGCGCTTG